MTDPQPRQRPRRIGCLAGLAVIILAVGIYAWWPVPPFNEWPGSPASASPDGALTAQVFFRQYRRAGFSVTSEPGDGFRSYLRVRSARGPAREFDARRVLSTYRVGESPFTISWTGPETFQLSVSSSVAAIGICLPTGVRLLSPQDLRKIDEPGVPLNNALRKRLLAIGRTEQELAGFKAVQVDGNFCGASMKDFVCDRADVLLLLGPKFSCHGQVISRGPIVCTGETYPMMPMASASWIFFDDQSHGPEDIAATEILLAPDAHVWSKTGPTRSVPGR